MSASGHRSETDKIISDRARGTAEERVLGRSPTTSMVRIAAFVALFIIIGGTVFFLLGR